MCSSLISLRLNLRTELCCIQTSRISSFNQVRLEAIKHTAAMRVMLGWWSVVHGVIACHGLPRESKLMGNGTMCPATCDQCLNLFELPLATGVDGITPVPNLHWNGLGW